MLLVHSYRYFRSRVKLQGEDRTFTDKKSIIVILVEHSAKVKRRAQKKTSEVSANLKGVHVPLVHSGPLILPRVPLAPLHTQPRRPTADVAAEEQLYVRL